MNKGENTKQHILEVAKAEFLEKGFNDASVRNIAKTAGLTTGAIFRYFPDKESLFTALVEPAGNSLYDQYSATQEGLTTESSPSECQSLVESDSDEYILQMLDVVYDNFDAFKLIICCSEGTEYANYIERLTQISVASTYSLIAFLKSNGIPIADVPEPLIYMICSANLIAFFKIVEMNESKEDAQNYVKKLFAFYNSGWRTLLEF